MSGTTTRRNPSVRCTASAANEARQMRSFRDENPGGDYRHSDRRRDGRGDPQEDRVIAGRRALFPVAEDGVRNGAQHEPHLLQREQPCG